VSCYLVQEIDGTSRFTLEDGSGFLLLEFCPPPPPGGDTVLGGDRRVRHEVIRRHEPIDDEVEEMMAVILSRL
jgi:hypothetical protein